MTLMHPATALLVAHAIQEDLWATAKKQRASHPKKEKDRR